MLLMPEELADISNPWLRNDSMDTVSMFGNSSVFIHPLCAAVEKIGKFISKIRANDKGMKHRAHRCRVGPSRWLT
jgi:hypothetical protein